MPRLLAQTDRLRETLAQQHLVAPQQHKGSSHFEKERPRKKKKRTPILMAPQQLAPQQQPRRCTMKCTQRQRPQPPHRS
jgi:hypothetical protein